MKVKYLASQLLILFFISGIVSSCGGNSSSSGSESKNYKHSGSSGYTLKFNSPHSVTAYLSHKTFKDADGTTISFSGGASSVSVNGQVFGGAVQINDYGVSEEGIPYALFSFSAPYGDVTFYLTELDEDFGGRLPDKVIIFDLNDPDNLFYKR